MHCWRLYVYGTHKACVCLGFVRQTGHPNGCKLVVAKIKLFILATGILTLSVVSGYTKAHKISEFLSASVFRWNGVSAEPILKSFIRLWIETIKHSWNLLPYVWYELQISDFGTDTEYYSSFKLSRGGFSRDCVCNQSSHWSNMGSFHLPNLSSSFWIHVCSAGFQRVGISLSKLFLFIVMPNTF